MREQIWGTLCDLKFKSFCVGFLLIKFQELDRAINIFLALASSGSIAAWAIWNQFPFVWGGIIACSQVLTALKPYIPYFKYVKVLNAKSVLLDNLTIEFEKLWYKFDNDKITEDSASEAYFDLKKQMNSILNFDDDHVFSVDDDDKIVQKANDRMSTYLKNSYDVSPT